jgi:ABC-type transport system involved in multi-copper enzyme maturation permease subunit
VIRVIAGATMRESIRSRAFIGLMALYLCAALISRIAGWVSGTDGNVVTTNMIMSLQSLFGVLVAVATGTALVQSEIQQKTLYTILSRPVLRWHFVVGKFLGLCGALVVGQLAMIAIGMAYLWLTGAPVSWLLVLAGLMTMLEVLVMAAVSLCWTTLSTPLLAVALCLVTYALGHAVGELPNLMYHLKGVQVPICAALASLVPNLDHFTYRDAAVAGKPIGVGALAENVAYGALWIALLVVITVAVVRRKQL